MSFVSNTNWQSYVPETAASYFSQMAAFTWQNFVSAATGIAVAMALIRGLTRHSGDEVGNFWVDLTRSCLWILLPGAIVIAMFFMSAGMVQKLGGPGVAHTIEGATQTIARGPVASQEAIKLLGTNGGGFFNANSAHPFENPTPLTNFVEVLAFLSIAAGLTYTFGRYARNQRQGWALFAAMAVIFLLSLGDNDLERAEPATRTSPTPASARSPPRASPAGTWRARRCASARTARRCSRTRPPTPPAAPSTRSMDSLTPLGGGTAMLNIAIGENIFGGVGTGIMFMLIFALAGRVHRRTDGRADAGVPGEEDRVRGNEADNDRDPHPRDEHSRLQRARRDGGGRASTGG